MPFETEATFACKLLPLLDDDAANHSVIFSPTSVLTGLAMLFVGTGGKTEKEIENVIGKDKSRNDIIQEFSDQIKYYSQSKNENARVTIANKLFVSNVCDLLPEFCDIINKKFDGAFEKINLNDRHKAAAEINSFVTKATNGQIKQIVEENDINSNTLLILINALHFKAPWTYSFTERKMQSFHSKQAKTIEFMSVIVPSCYGWSYVENGRWKALGIPYEDEKAWFFIILPDENSSLSDLLSSVNHCSFEQWMHINRKSCISVEMPLIDMVYDIDMTKKFHDLGIVTAFTSACNTTKMTKNSCHLDKVLHKSCIKVNENGTEASAATADVMIPKSAGPRNYFSFMANRPFLYFITTVESAQITEKVDILKPLNLIFIGTFC